MSLLLAAHVSYAADAASVPVPTKEDTASCAKRYEATPPADRTALTTICARNLATARSVATLQSQSTQLEASNPDCFPDSRGWFGRLMNRPRPTPSKTQLEACGVSLENNQKKLTALNTDLSQQQIELQLAENEYLARAKVNAMVKDAFTDMQLSIFSQELKAADVGARLTKMATGLDNSALGLYLRDRMAGLLNSDQMCTAVKECGTSPRKGKSITGKSLNSVFDNTMKTAPGEVAQPPVPKALTEAPAIK